MEAKGKELSLEQHLREGIEQFKKAGGVVPGDICSAEIIIGVTEAPIVAVKLIDDDMSSHQTNAAASRKVIQETMNIIGFLDAALTRVPTPKDAFTSMDARWLHGTYKKPGGAEYTILGCTTYSSVNILNNRTGKRRSVSRTEVGKAVAENGLTTKNGEFIPPTASKTVMKGIKEMEYGELYKKCLGSWGMKGKGDIKNIGRTFNDGKLVGVFIGGTIRGYYSHVPGDVPGILYIKRFSDGKVVLRDITGKDDPAAYVVDEAGNTYRLFE